MSSRKRRRSGRPGAKPAPPPPRYVDWAVATWSVPVVLFAVFWGGAVTAGATRSAPVTIAVAVGAGVLLVGGGVALLLRATPRWRGLGVAMVAGTVLAAVLGVWLALT